MSLSTTLENEVKQYFQLFWDVSSSRSLESIKSQTNLAAKLVRRIKVDFQYFSWQDARKFSSVDDILNEFLKILSLQKIINFSTNVNKKIDLLIPYLEEFRCLLVLNDAEFITTNYTSKPQSNQPIEEYGNLLKQVGSSNHQSCLLLTSRAKPMQVDTLESETNYVHSLLLNGLSVKPAQKFLSDNGLCGSEEEFTKFTEIYNGHPSMLNIATGRVKQLHDSDISKFLVIDRPIPKKVMEILNEEFNSSTDLEKSILYWLAINREPVSTEEKELCNDIIPQPKQQDVEDALEDLMYRSLIQRVAEGITLQNIILDYTTNRLIEKFIAEIETKDLALFHTHALMKATAKERVRDAQLRLILKPVAEKLIQRLNNVETQLIEILETIRAQPQLQTGYAAGNVLNLLCCLNADFSKYNFSNLTIRQAYLQDKTVHGINFANSILLKSVFTQDFGTVFSVAFSPDGTILFG